MEDIPGGESRLCGLSQTGNEQADADGPEYEPFAHQQPTAGNVLSAPLYDDAKEGEEHHE